MPNVYLVRKGEHVRAFRAVDHHSLLPTVCRSGDVPSGDHIIAQRLDSKALRNQPKSIYERWAPLTETHDAIVESVGNATELAVSWPVQFADGGYLIGRGIKVLPSLVYD